LSEKGQNLRVRLRAIKREKAANWPPFTCFGRIPLLAEMRPAVFAAEQGAGGAHDVPAGIVVADEGGRGDGGGGADRAGCDIAGRDAAP